MISSLLKRRAEVRLFFVLNSQQKKSNNRQNILKYFLFLRSNFKQNHSRMKTTTNSQKKGYYNITYYSLFILLKNVFLLIYRG